MAAMADRNDFSNSESLCHCDASHQVLAQSNFRFGRRIMSFEEFQDDGHLGYRNGTIIKFPIKFRLNLIYGF